MNANGPVAVNCTNANAITTSRQIVLNSNGAIVNRPVMIMATSGTNAATAAIGATKHTSTTNYTYYNPRLEPCETYLMPTTASLSEVNHRPKVSVVIGGPDRLARSTAPPPPSSCCCCMDRLCILCHCSIYKVSIRPFFHNLCCCVLHAHHCQCLLCTTMRVV